MAGLKNRLAFLLLAALPGGCGFAPLYVLPEGQGAAALAGIFVAPAQAGPELRLYEEITHQLGLPARPAPGARGGLELAFSLEIINRDIFSQPDAQIARRKLLLRAALELRAAGGQIVWQSEARASSAYDRGDSEYANLKTRIKARKEALAALAAQIRLQLAAFLANGGQGQAG